MNSLLTPILLIIISIGLFFTFTDEQYEVVKTLQAENEEYEIAIERANDLLKRRNQLLAQYNSFSQQDLKRLVKMVPDSIDNVRLIIDINGVTSRYGVEVRNLKLDSVKAGAGQSSSSNTQTAAVVDDVNDNKPYRSAPLTFSVSTDYETFLKILRDLEASLRILDVTNITFTSSDKEPYTYNVTVKTYWMK